MERKIRLHNIFLVIVLLLIFISCKKEKETPSVPSISFKIAKGFVSKDTTVATGAQFRFGISASSSDVNLTNFVIKLNNVAFVDTGFNSQSFVFEKLITKGVNDIDQWTFIIRNKDGKSAQLSLTVKRDTTASFSNIIYYQSVTLGAQSNTVTGSFMSLSNGIVYKQDSAFDNQPLIDLLYYYDDAVAGDKNTIASPGANIDPSIFTGATGLFNWTTLNTTRFVKLTITETDFDNIKNDSLLLASYDELNGKRKAKLLTAGDIYSFKNQSSKYGIFLVKSVDGADAGTVTIDIKVQK